MRAESEHAHDGFVWVSAAACGVYGVSVFARVSAVMARSETVTNRDGMIVFGLYRIER